MELYLFTYDRPIVLVRPGLLMPGDGAVAPKVATPAKADLAVTTDGESDPTKDAKATEVPATTGAAGQTRVELELKGDDPLRDDDKRGAIEFRYSRDGKTWIGGGTAIYAGGKLSGQLPTDAANKKQDFHYEFFRIVESDAPTGGGRLSTADRLFHGRFTTAPATAGAPAPGVPALRAGEAARPEDADPLATASRRELPEREREIEREVGSLGTDVSHRLATLMTFKGADGKDRGYWVDGTPFTAKEMDDLITRLQKGRDALPGVSGGFSAEARSTLLRVYDNRIERAEGLRPIAKEYDSVRDDFKDGSPDLDDANEFLQDYARGRDKGTDRLGTQSVIDGWLDKDRTPSGVEEVQDARSGGGSMRIQSDGGGGNGGNGTMDTQSSFNRVIGGVHDTLGALEHGWNFANQIGSSFQPGGAFGSAGFGGGSGGYGDYGLGGFGFMYSSYSDYESDRKDKAELERLKWAIARGNLDVIGRAVDNVAEQTRRTLQKVAILVIQGMEAADQEQEQIVATLGNNPNLSQSQMHALGGKLSSIAAERQSAVGVLRDVKALYDEDRNFSKSWRDNDLRGRVDNMRFA